MSEFFCRNKHPANITVIDIYGSFATNPRIRTVQLCDREIAFEVLATPSNSDDFVIIFLDSNRIANIEKYLNVLFAFGGNYSYYKDFHDIDECVDFISSLKYEKVFLVLFINEAELLVPLIHEISTLIYIYICFEEEASSIDSKQFNWINIYPKICDKIYELSDELRCRMKKDMELMRIPVVEPMLFSMNTTAMKNINADCAAYQWNQILLDALRHLPKNNKSRQDILTICKTQYKDDPCEFKKIEQFEKTYQPQSAIWWYSQDCFLYKLINKALQTEDIDILFKFRFFIIDLYDQLSDLHNKSKTENSNILTVYRGQQITPNELENLQNNINNIISLKSFLSTTTNKNVALMYAGDGSQRPQLESILFEILVDVNKSDKPLADISQQSQMSHEDEVLLSMSMLFTVKSIEQIENNVWKIQLMTTNESSIKLNDYLDELCLNFSEYDDPLFRLASLLSEVGSYEKAEKYLLMLLEEYREDYGRIYNVLGLCNYAKHNYRRALHYYIQAMNHFIVTQNTEHPICCYLYNNIGVIYEGEDDYEQAMNFYKKALEIYLQHPTGHREMFVTILARIGHIYAKFGNYDEAFKKYYRAYEIVENLHSSSTHSVATLYSYMGDTYLKLGQHNKSLEYYKKSLQILQEVLPNDKAPIAQAYESIGVVYGFKGEYDEALRQYKEAERIFVANGIIAHIDLAGVYGEMGVIYRKKKEYEIALYYHKECLNIKKKFCPENSIGIAKTYNNIGVVYHEMINIELSIEYTKKAINCIENCQTPNEVELAIYYGNLGSCYADVQDVEQALYYHNLSLDIKCRVFPSNHPTFSITFHNIAQALCQIGNILTAIDYSEKAVKISEEALGVNHPNYQIFMALLNELKTI
ncbi:hypothetical protein I4U23_010879 [Adineta vaga]|nr:hypothetical protein I4U23_010879 [Adineta vaga]